MLTAISIHSDKTPIYSNLSRRYDYPMGRARHWQISIISPGSLKLCLKWVVKNQTYSFWMRLESKFQNSSTKAGCLLTPKSKVVDPLEVSLINHLQMLPILLNTSIVICATCLLLLMNPGFIAYRHDYASFRSLSINDFNFLLYLLLLIFF